MLKSEFVKELWRGIRAVKGKKVKKRKKREPSLPALEPQNFPCVGVGSMISRLNYKFLVQPELDKATRAVSRITYGLVAVGKADGYSFEVVD